MMFFKKIVINVGCDLQPQRGDNIGRRWQPTFQQAPEGRNMEDLYEKPVFRPSGARKNGVSHNCCQHYSPLDWRSQLALIMLALPALIGCSVFRHTNTKEMKLVAALLTGYWEDDFDLESGVKIATHPDAQFISNFNMEFALVRKKSIQSVVQQFKRLDDSTTVIFSCPPIFYLTIEKHQPVLIYGDEGYREEIVLLNDTMLMLKNPEGHIRGLRKVRL